MQGNSWTVLLIYVAIFAAMYFILITPQRRREKQLSQLRASLKEGDEVVTNGGIIGKVTHVSDNEVSIESGLERTKLKVAKWAILNIQKLQEEGK